MNTNLTNTKQFFAKLPKTVWVGGISFCILMGIASYMLETYHTQKSSLPTVAVSYHDIKPYVTATGEIDVDDAISLRSPAVGQLVNVLVEPGTVVKSGQPIARLDSYALASKNLETTQSRLDHLKTISQLAQAKVAADQSQSPAQAALLAQDQAAIALAETQLKSTEQLLKDANASFAANTTVSDAQKSEAKSELDKAQSVVDVDQVALNQAKDKLVQDQKLADLGPLQEQTKTLLAYDQSAIDVAQQQLTSAQNVVSDLQSQYSGSVASANNSSQATIQAAKTAMDQQQGVLSSANLQLTQAKNTLAKDTAAGAPSDQLAADQAAVDVAQQEADNAQQLFQDLQAEYNQAVSQSSSTSMQTLSAIEALDQAKGSVLVYQAQLQQAQAKLAADSSDQNAKIAQAANQNESQIAADQAAIASNIIQLNSAQMLLKDAQDVFKASNAVPASVLAQAQTALDQAKGSVATSQASLAQAQAKLNADALPTDQRAILSDQTAAMQAMLDVEATELDLQKAKDALNQAQIIAPVDGVVAAVDKKAGDGVQPSEEVCVIAPTNPNHQIVGLVSASDVSSVAAGAAVEIQSDQFAGSLAGKVRFVSPIPKASQQNTQLYQYQVYVDVEGPLPSDVRSGMAVMLKIQGRVVSHVASVPDTAIMEQNSKRGVYVRNPQDGSYKFQEVQIGASDDNQVEVKGLKIGTVVALKKP